MADFLNVLVWEMFNWLEVGRQQWISAFSPFRPNKFYIPASNQNLFYASAEISIPDLFHKVGTEFLTGSEDVVGGPREQSMFKWAELVDTTAQILQFHISTSQALCWKESEHKILKNLPLFLRVKCARIREKVAGTSQQISKTHQMKARLVRLLDHLDCNCAF